MGAAGHRNILAVQVAPDLPGAVDTVVRLVRLDDQGLQFGVTDGADRGCGLAFVVGVVGGRGNLAVVVGEDPADRLDAAEAVLVLVDERYERVCGRLNLSVPIPSLAATAFIAAHSVSYSGRTSATIRTARRRSSSGYWKGRAMTRSSQTIESLPNPERFSPDRGRRLLRFGGLGFHEID